MPQLELFSPTHGLSSVQKVRHIAKTDPSSIDGFLKSLNSFPVVVGVDEAGRGPLAGPVVACACVQPATFPACTIVDSKKLSELQIIDTYCQLQRAPGLHFATCRVESDEIDRVNILQATLLAMHRAVLALETSIDLVLVDGNKTPNLSIPTVAVIKGDQHCKVISLASIIAKYVRDEIMREYDKLYPNYGFARHKGYGTAMHVEMLQRYGACPIHRKTFEPVSAVL